MWKSAFLIVHLKTNKEKKQNSFMSGAERSQQRCFESQRNQVTAMFKNYPLKVLVLIFDDNFLIVIRFCIIPSADRLFRMNHSVLFLLPFQWKQSKREFFIPASRIRFPVESSCTFSYTLFVFLPNFNVPMRT